MRQSHMATPIIEHEEHKQLRDALGLNDYNHRCLACRERAIKETFAVLNAQN